MKKLAHRRLRWVSRSLVAANIRGRTVPLAARRSARAPARSSAAWRRNSAGGAVVGGVLGGAAGAIIGAETTPRACYARDRYGRRYAVQCP